MAKLTDKQISKRKEGDRARLAAAGTQAALQIGHMIQRAAIAAKQSGKRGAEILAPLQDEIAATITKGMMAAHVVGIQRIRLDAKVGKGLKLESKIDAVLREMRAKLAMTPADWAELEEKYGKQTRDLMGVFTSETGEQIDDAINLAIREQASARDGIRIMQETLTGVSGVPKAAHVAEAIFRTQSSLAYSSGQWAQLQDEAIQEILWGYKYVTVGDNRVRDEHEAWEGVTLPKSDPWWDTHWPPNGWNCRCDVIEIYEPREVKTAPATFVPSVGPNAPSKENPGGNAIIPTIAPGFEFNPGKTLNFNTPGSAS